MTDTISKQALLDTIEITSFEDYGDYITVRELIENFQTIENEPQTTKIIEAYSQGFKDGADAARSVEIKALHKRHIEPYVTIEQTEPQIYGLFRKGELSDDDVKELKKQIGQIIEYADRKTENSSEKPNNCEYVENPSGDVWECGCFLDTYCEHQIYDRNPDGTINIVECGYEPKTEPQTDKWSHVCIGCANNNTCEFAFTDAVKICRYINEPQSGKE